MNLVLVLNEGDRVLVERTFHDGKVTFGRHPTENLLPIPDRVKKVSVFHGCFEFVDGVWTVKDLRSTNGTMLGARRLDPDVAVPVADGDIVTVGPFTIAVRLVPNIETFEQTVAHFDADALADRLCEDLHGAFAAGSDIRARVADAVAGLLPEQARAVLKRVAARHGGDAATPAAPVERTDDEQLYLAGFQALRDLAGRFVGNTRFARAEDVGRFARLLQQTLEITFEWLARCMQGREAFAEQFGAEVTMVLQRGGNPLKNLEQPDAIARHLLDWAAARELVTARQQLEGVYRDLSEHQMGLLAGVKEAIRAVLERLAPEQIEAALPKGGWSIASRSGKAWDAYRDLYREVVEERSKLFHEVVAPNLRRGYLQAHEGAPPRPPNDPTQPSPP